MSVSALLQDARHARSRLESAKAAERLQVMAYMRGALEQGASWSGIGRALGVTATGARRYYYRNKEDGG